MVCWALQLLRRCWHLYAVYFLCYYALCTCDSEQSRLHFFPDVAGCLTCWCPCVTFGRVAEVVDRGSTCMSSKHYILFVHPYRLSISLADSYFFAACCMNGTLYVLLMSIGCQWLYTCSKRSSMRAQYNLQESPCLDCCVHFWCDTCALCQEYRELEKRGFNMAKGIPPREGKLGSEKNRCLQRHTND